MQTDLIWASVKVKQQVHVSACVNTDSVNSSGWMPFKKKEWVEMVCKYNKVLISIVVFQKQLSLLPFI